MAPRKYELEILSIEKNMLEKIDYKSLINNFASKKKKGPNLRFGLRPPKNLGRP